jgi:phosphatidylserine/phosphatidylglycerophosphate/cardiolipin synthase-like enzyme
MHFKKPIKACILLIVCSFFQLAATTIEVLFSPQDRPAVRLLEEIGKAQKHIYAAIYYFSDKSVALEIYKAHQRGVKVEIICDWECSQSSYSKIPLIVQTGIPVYARHKTPNTSGRGWRKGIMHNKFAIIDDTLWTGSFNWTISANFFNDENVTIIHDTPTREKFFACFQILKELSTKMEPTKTGSPAGLDLKEKTKESEENLQRVLTQTLNHIKKILRQWRNILKMFATIFEGEAPRM